MSDCHILAGDKYGNRYRVVFHIPVPDQVNAVGVSYRMALVQYLGGATEIKSEIPELGTELTQLQAGELVEYGESFYSNPNETLAQKQVKLDARFNEVKNEVLQDWQDVLSYWGYSRDVP